MSDRGRKKRGKFIVFEGTDGCGKTTHVSLLCEHLSRKTGRKCLSEREPDSRNIVGAIIRSALYGSVKILPESMAYLHIADRLEHIGHILPLLDEGYDIVCDRYYISNMAYNAGDGLSVGDIYRLNAPCAAKLQPDLVVFLDVSPEETARRRSQDRTDAEIYDEDEKQKKIRANYAEALSIVEAAGVRVLRVDASRPKEEVAAEIAAAADRL